jgi:hypothetical protein
MGLLAGFTIVNVFDMHAENSCCKHFQLFMPGIHTYETCT